MGIEPTTMVLQTMVLQEARVVLYLAEHELVSSSPTCDQAAFFFGWLPRWAWDKIPGGVRFPCRPNNTDVQRHLGQGFLKL